MQMDAALANHLTSEERREHLLGVIACALTGQRPHQLFPWLRTDPVVFNG